MLTSAFATGHDQGGGDESFHQRGGVFECVPQLRDLWKTEARVSLLRKAPADALPVQVPIIVELPCWLADRLHDGSMH